MSVSVTECDVLVVGGGPAGSTAAALLAEKGRHVVLLEKDQHPRFHIGESLLPRNTKIFDRLGLREQVAAMGVHKPGAEFISDASGKRVRFSFAEGLDKVYTYSWQVKRAEFDEMLWRHAQAKGAEAQDQMRVTEVQFAPPGGRARVTAVGPDGAAREYAPRYLLDATGRDTLLANKLGGKRANKFNSTAALFAHFQGVGRTEGEQDGFISVHLVDDGWFWMIPLPGEVMSVGFVGNRSAFAQRKGSPHELFMARIAQSPSVSARMQHATMQTEVTSTGNFSYDNPSCHGPGWLMVGDSFAFLDPVFSSGVLLAMSAAEMGAEVADTWLDNPQRGAAMARRMEQDIRHGMARIAWLIYRINTPALRMLFMEPGNRFRMKDGLISLLAGNLRGGRDSILPVLAFKTVYHFVSLLLRLGVNTGMQLQAGGGSK